MTILHMPMKIHLFETWHIHRFLESFSLLEYVQNLYCDRPYPEFSWLPDIELMTAREQEGGKDGFFIAAKGGHNAESHNHNDVGGYIVYNDASPVLIDAGSGTYTKSI